MTARDRLVVSVLGAIAVAVAAWLLLVGPKLDEAGRLSGVLAAQGRQLQQANAQVAAARADAAGYGANVAALRGLYRAVPASDAVPKLLVTLDRASQNKRVDFQVVNVGGAAAAAPGGGAPATAAPSGAAPAAPGALPAALKPTTFSFVFAGGYVALQKFLHAVQSFTLTDGSGVIARGRLLTIDSVTLAPGQGSAATASVTATAYSQPAVSPSTTVATGPAS